MRLPRFIIPFLVLSFLLGACGSNDSPSSVPAADTTGQWSDEDGAQHDFRLFLSGALQDTLYGEATFGTVVNSNTGQRRFVIEMAVSGDQANGVYVTHGDTSHLQTGTYELVSADDSTVAQGQHLSVVWRAGVRRHFTSSGGTITLETANDTLVAGSMEATLRGTLAQEDAPAEDKQAKEVQLYGRFRAENGSVGYIGI